MDIELLNFVSFNMLYFGCFIWIKGLGNAIGDILEKIKE